MTLRLLLVDDHPVVRAGLRGMLAGEPDLEVVAEAADGEEAVRMSAELRPDVVLMDLRMPGMDGAEATRRIAALDPAPAVLVLTTYDTDHDILRAGGGGRHGLPLEGHPESGPCASTACRGWRGHGVGTRSGCQVARPVEITVEP